ncbi:hypothetical protein CW705_06940 [Candidatus Bathyarchaeota archaeon]|nr:MAG: hypothetical protein CW705_06940 [Candidatus Bathyarchaeota archaeon]
MGGRAFLCQISEKDWKISRIKGVYGNREGSVKKGAIKYFDEKSNTVQSIIEDLIGMRKGDLVFFHVIKKEKGKESSIHGVYRVREEPFYNRKKIWTSKLVYPYRFCFEPHPDHVELCRYDAYIPLTRFYAAIEAGLIRSITTLEREVHGQAHAVKTLTREDAKEIIKLLYREFPLRRSEQPIKFKPLKIQGPPLKRFIKRVGELEFAIKAVIAYKLGHEDPEFTKLIPACRYEEYDFLIQTFVGPTIRKPVDLICIGYGKLTRAITIIEVKTKTADINDFIQLLKYQEAFRIRNLKKDDLAYKFSLCLIAQRFKQELMNYCYLRKMLIPWEEIALVNYVPTSNNRDASFRSEALIKPISFVSKPIPTIRTSFSEIISNPQGFYLNLRKEVASGIHLDILLSKDNVIFLQKRYKRSNFNSILGYVLIYVVPAKCTEREFTLFMKQLYDLAESLKEKFIAIEPIIISRDYDKLVTYFVEKYNAYEVQAMRQPISLYVVK